MRTGLQNSQEWIGALQQRRARVVLCVFAAFTKTMSLVGGFGGFGNFGTPVAQPAFGGCTG